MPLHTLAVRSLLTLAHRGREHHDSLQLIGVQPIVPNKHKLGERPPSEIAKARIRLVIESVFSRLKRQMRMEDHLPKTLPGLAQRIILINTVPDRPHAHSPPTTDAEPTSSL